MLGNVTMQEYDAANVLQRFSAPTRAWFTASFPAPTPAQVGAWDAISRGEHTLVVAPTGSGKTLSAFLWALDRFLLDGNSAPRESPPEEARGRCRVLYVSPLKALAVDVERNLRSPLVGIRQAAARLGHSAPEVSVAMRSGDTPAAERRAFARDGADILITTPESLFLLLTSQARTALSGVETVIIDEVHAVAGTKRGAHLAITLERLDSLLARPAQRIGLSATVRPVDEVARYLAGGRPVSTVHPPSTKEWDLEVVVPVPDMTDPGTGGMSQLGIPPEGRSGVRSSDEESPVRRRSNSGSVDDDWITGPGPLLPDLSTDQPFWAPADDHDPHERASIWPHVERRVAQLIAEHSSTLVFTNSRRVAERFTARLNEDWQERAHSAAPDDPAMHDGQAGHEERTDRRVFAPAQVMGQSGTSHGAVPALARAHHGSVSKEQRALIEDALKSGQLPAVVATSSLELGIDMGAVDLVVQVAGPPSVASGLQRVGRAGHQVGAISQGIFFPTHRADLIATAVVVDRMRQGLIEELRVLSNPLDVLAQQIVAMVAMDDWDTAGLYELIRRTASYATLPRPVFEAVLDMLAGRYPGEDLADLRPRVEWDRITDTLTARRGAQLLAVTSGGTIPDRGLYAVMLATGDGPGRRVGELDEEMVYESRVGDVFTLGTTSWRIEDITHDQVLVTPAPGQVGRLPFWKGESQGRPAELGAAVGEFIRTTADMAPQRAAEALAEGGLDEWAAQNLLAYLREQREATGQLPDDRTIVVERFRDEIGDWRLVIHSPWGRPVHGPWALCLAARLRERYGTDVQALAADDGIVLRLPDLGGWDGQEGQSDRQTAGDSPVNLDAEIAELLTLDPDEVADLVTQEIGGSALFAARFRECAARALLLPRRRPGRRQPLWQQRQRSAQLLEVASRYPTFPIVLEAVRECVQDVYDVEALTELMHRIGRRDVQVVSVVSRSPSPFARSLLMGYVAQYLYEGDSPLAERRAAALSLDPALLAELLGRGEGASLRDLLDPQVVTQTAAELQRLTPERAARDSQDVLDLLRVLGPLSDAELTERTQESVREQLPHWVTELADTRRIIEVRIAGQQRWADAQDAARLRDALGTAIPLGLPAAFTEPVENPLGDLVVRYARTHTPFTVGELADRLGLGQAVIRSATTQLVSAGRLVQGALSPQGTGQEDLCDAEVMRLLRRRSLAALRQEVEPVTQPAYARFLPRWQGATLLASAAGSAGRGSGLRGVDGLHRAVEQLAGAVLPASAVESLILPARVVDYVPSMLDELMSSGEVLWQGHGTLPGEDGWVSLHLAETAALTLAAPEPIAQGVGATDSATGAPSAEPETAAAHMRGVLERVPGAAYLFRGLMDAVGSTDDQAVLETLWQLVWAGHLSADTFAPVRALLSGGRGAHRSRSRRPARAGRWSRTAISLGGRGAGSLSGRPGPVGSIGRWSLLPLLDPDPTVRALASAEQLLDRYGVLTRGSVVAERIPGGFAGVYRVLAGAEEAGRVRRGYVVEGLGAAQFGTTGAIDRLRAMGAPADGPEVILLAATDPANPYGASIPWPENGSEPREGKGSGSHRPGRKAGAMVVLVDGHLALYLERGGRTALTFPIPEQDDREHALIWSVVATAVADTVRSGLIAGLMVTKIDGASALGSASPVAGALLNAGFHTAPQGLRLRR